MNEDESLFSRLLAAETEAAQWKTHYTRCFTLLIERSTQLAAVENERLRLKGVGQSLGALRRTALRALEERDKAQLDLQKARRTMIGMYRTFFGELGGH